jgi:hypothetical protein
MKITPKPPSWKRKPGPHKGDGGGSRRLIFNEPIPDRWIIASALKIADLERQRAFDVLQLLESVLTDQSCIEYEIGPGIFSTVNTQPPYGSASNRNDRQPLAAPGGHALRHSRLENLSAKVAKYQKLQRGNKLTGNEARWLGLYHLALDFLAHGEREQAALLLDSVGWTVPPAARERLGRLADISLIISEKNT